MRQNKMRIVFIFLLTMNAVYAENISWLGDYDKALAKARNERKQIMVLLVKKDCKLCNKIIVRNFMNHNYISDINKEYVSIIITFGNKNTYPVELYYSTNFPTLFFVDSIDETFLRDPVYGNKIDEINFNNSPHTTSIP